MRGRLVHDRGRQRCRICPGPVIRRPRAGWLPFGRPSKRQGQRRRKKPCGPARMTQDLCRRGGSTARSTRAEISIPTLLASATELAWDELSRHGSDGCRPHSVARARGEACLLQFPPCRRALLFTILTGFVRTRVWLAVSYFHQHWLRRCCALTAVWSWPSPSNLWQRGQRCPLRRPSCRSHPAACGCRRSWS
jgi:hypothetical protein